jgi:hypothetical protein
MTAQPLLDRLMRRIEHDTNGGCWLWSGAIITGAGYGNIPVNGKTTAASRVAWTVFRGPVPHGHFVCHKCDVRLCCNPDHLFVASHRENMADMARKGRGRGLRGEASGKARLTEQQVICIRRHLLDGRTYRAIAAEFGVHYGTIQAINERRSWAWFDGPQEVAA